MLSIAFMFMALVITNVNLQVMETDPQVKILASKELIEAVDEGNLEGVKQALKKGADVNYQQDDEYGCSALHYAKGYEMVQLLLDNGAQVDIRTRLSSQIPLMTICCNPEMDNESKRIIQLLLDRGADINAQDNNGTTALMYAASASSRKNKDSIIFLLSKGCNPNTTNQKGKTFTNYGPSDAFCRELRTMLDKKNKIFPQKEKWGNDCWLSFLRYSTLREKPTNKTQKSRNIASFLKQRAIGQKR